MNSDNTEVPSLLLTFVNSLKSLLRKKNNPVLDLGLISIASLGPRASTKVESHVNFTESQKVSQPNFFLQY